MPVPAKAGLRFILRVIYLSQDAGIWIIGFFRSATGAVCLFSLMFVLQ